MEPFLVVFLCGIDVSRFAAVITGVGHDRQNQQCRSSYQQNRCHVSDPLSLFLPPGASAKARRPARLRTHLYSATAVPAGMEYVNIANMRLNKRDFWAALFLQIKMIGSNQSKTAFL